MMVVIPTRDWSGFDTKTWSGHDAAKTQKHPERRVARGRERPPQPAGVLARKKTGKTGSLPATGGFLPRHFRNAARNVTLRATAV